MFQCISQTVEVSLPLPLPHPSPPLPLYQNTLKILLLEQVGIAGGAGKPGFIPGNPGVDYPDFKTIPVTDFTCQNFLLPGFYADTFTSCQVRFSALSS